MKKAKKGRNVAGVIPLVGWSNSFDFPWPDYLQPIRQGMLAVERSVYECAYAGCDSIWIVCGEDVAPIVKKRLGKTERIIKNRFLYFTLRYRRKTEIEETVLAGPYYMVL